MIDLHWLRFCDVPDIAEIENAASVSPWSVAEIERLLKMRDVITLGVRPDGVVRGILFFRLRKQHLRLLSIAVAPSWRNQGLGTAMVDAMKQRLSRHRRDKIIALVPEQNKLTRGWLENRGFWAYARCPGGDERDEQAGGRGAVYCTVLAFSFQQTTQRWSP